MKTIIIPDVHQRIGFANKILSTETYDEAVFLGDYFDTHDDEDSFSFTETCQTLRYWALHHSNSSKIVLLIGNHDLPYIYCNNGPGNRSIRNKPVHYFASGFTKTKAKKFRKSFYDKDLRDGFFVQRFKCAHRTQGFTLSHAGIVPAHLSYNEDIDHLVNVSIPSAWENFRFFEHPKNYLLGDVGECRRGKNRIGGILWLDGRREFYGHSDIGSQVFGHTHFDEPFYYDDVPNAPSWCIDTGRHYGVITDGKFEVKEA